MLWLAAYLTGFPPVGLHTLRWTHGLAPMWSGLYLISTRVNSRKVTRFDECQCPLGLIPHFYPEENIEKIDTIFCVNALSGLYLISTKNTLRYLQQIMFGVNALSGLYLISTDKISGVKKMYIGCQCPLGLIPHFYSSTAFSFQKWCFRCQCPLGLIPHFYGTPSKT